MTTNNRNAPIIQAVDKETIRKLVSLPHENQVLVKGFVLGLCNQAPTPPTAQQPRPSV